MSAAIYALKPSSVEALQWPGGEEAKQEIEAFCEPAIVRYIPDGTLIVSRQETTFTLVPTDWVLKYADQTFAGMTNSLFVDLYTLVEE